MELSQYLTDYLKTIAEVLEIPSFRICIGQAQGPGFTNSPIKPGTRLSNERRKHHLTLPIAIFLHSI